MGGLLKVLEYPVGKVALACSAIAILLIIFAIKGTYPIIAIILGLVLLAAAIIVIFIERSKTDIDSSKWFQELENNLSDCTQALIYLREFKHPDQIREGRHHDSLLRLMDLFALKLVENEDFHIFAYRQSGDTGKDPMDWLINQIGNVHGGKITEEDIRRRVCILETQPVSNSATVYMIDNDLLLYNQRRSDNQVSYHKSDVSKSVIPFFIEKGFKMFASENFHVGK